MAVVVNFFCLGLAFPQLPDHMKDGVLNSHKGNRGQNTQKGIDMAPKLLINPLCFSTL